MPVAVIANRVNDVGVKRDTNADINKNVNDDNLISDIGVKVSTGTDANPRDLPSMPNSKTRIDKDGPTPLNPKSGNSGNYQR